MIGARIGHMTSQDVKVREGAFKRPDPNDAPVARRGWKAPGPMGALGCQVARRRDLNMSVSMDVLQDARKTMLALEGGAILSSMRAHSMLQTGSRS